MYIPVHEGARIDELIVADVTRQRQVALDEVIFTEVGKVALNAALTDTRRVVIPSPIRFQVLENDARIRGPVVVEIDTESRAGTNLGEFIKVFLHQAGIVYRRAPAEIIRVIAVTAFQ